MACRISLSQLLDEILSANAIGFSTADRPLITTGITTDTRQLQPGEVFLALRGETFNGHDFLTTAAQQGAIAAIVDAQYSVPDQGPPLPLIQVADTLQAYQTIAHWWRNQFTIPVIAVTGSVGKTTTKELIAAVLSTQGQVLKTQANYNNEIGVPKTLLELDTHHDYAVIEMGMRGQGEIALLSQIARPDLAVITNVGTAHIERLGSEAAIAEAKCELLAEMPPVGTAILNFDNPRLLATAARVWSGQQLTYGLTGGDLQGQLLENGQLSVAGMSLPLPLPGQHNALNYLAALAVAKALNISWEPLQAGLEVRLPAGRAQRYELANNVTLLDETYNAGVESMTAALHLLAQTPGQRRIAVLGTMRELGDYAPALHHQVGTVVQQLHLDHLFILAADPEATALAQGAGNVPSETFTNHESLVQRLHQVIQPGDRLLFKASRAVGLDQVVNRLRQVLA